MADGPLPKQMDMFMEQIEKKIKSGRITIILTTPLLFRTGFYTIIGCKLLNQLIWFLFTNVLPSLRWISEDGEISENECLQEGEPVPDLATVKDFIQYYIFSTNGMLTLHLIMSSVKDFTERLFAGITHVTKTGFDWRDTKNVYKIYD